MTNITETVQSALTSAGYGQYTSYAAPVIEALQAREDNAVEVLREQGQALGASEEQVDSVLEQAGLIEPSPEPTPDTASDDRLSRLESMVNRLVQAAANAGLRI